MYELKLHKNLTVGKWATYPLFKRILMIGNEVNRLKNALRNGQTEDEVLSCVERGLELVDLTINSVSKRTLRRELLRWLELFAEYYLPENSEKAKIEDLYSTL